MLKTFKNCNFLKEKHHVLSSAKGGNNWKRSKRKKSQQSVEDCALERATTAKIQRDLGIRSGLCENLGYQDACCARNSNP